MYLQDKLFLVASVSFSEMFMQIQIHRNGGLGDPPNLNGCSRTHARIVSNHHREFNDCNVITKRNSLGVGGTHGMEIGHILVLSVGLRIICEAVWLCINVRFPSFQKQHRH
jgi:hypothetical protein